MEYVRVGNSGLKITKAVFGSALTIGTENKNIDYASAMIDAAWDSGIRTFDTSNNYGMGEAERLLGMALQKYDRHEYVIFTKGSWPVGETPYDHGLSRKHILWSLEQSLDRLGLDYVDVYYAHRYDAETPMEEIVRTFNALIAEGKIRYWATSEWPVEALKECDRVCDKLLLEKPICEQFIYSYAVRKAESNGVIEYCRMTGRGMIGFSALCQGYLTGKYQNGVPIGSRIAKSEKINYYKTSNFYEQNKEKIDGFLEICNQYQIPYIAAALQWPLRLGIVPLFGASMPDQIRSNIEALEQVLPEDFWTALEKI